MRRRALELAAVSAIFTAMLELRAATAGMERRSGGGRRGPSTRRRLVCPSLTDGDDRRARDSADGDALHRYAGAGRSAQIVDLGHFLLSREGERPTAAHQTPGSDDEQKRRSRLPLPDESSGLPLLDRGDAAIELDERRQRSPMSKSAP
jgi:hypothetical protein